MKLRCGVSSLKGKKKGLCRVLQVTTRADPLMSEETCYFQLRIDGFIFTMCNLQFVCLSFYLIATSL